MGGESWGMVSPTVAVAAVNVEREEHWKHFDNSVNAVSFGFVATAILISMFLVMAIFERFLRPRSSPTGSRTHGDPEAPMMFDGKLRYPSPKMTVYARGVSVLMPGEQIPTYIAHPAPAPCPPERIARPLHQHSPRQPISFFSSISGDNLT
ncbi:uncharacterized protein LOC117925894 [Vitis riparia]|uniref:uncharacterized protein LOC117925894 n=1 Tax=Vitis riparia TaxID=96939 RepID=UPI00155AC907|nr:uncharacterized protein LOC117925894 [Vitis riparia]